MIIFKKILRNCLIETLAIIPFSLLINIQGKKLLLPTYHTVSDMRIPHLINLFSYCSVKQFERDLDFLQNYFTPISLDDLMDNIKGNKDLPDKSFLLTFDDGYREVVEVIAPILKRRSIPAVFFLNTAFIDNKELFFRCKASLIVDRINSLMKPDVINKIATLVQAKGHTITDIKTVILGIKYNHRHLLDETAHILEIDFNQYLLDNKPYLNSDEIRNLIKQGFIIGAHSIDHPPFSDIQLDEQLTQVLESLGKLKEQFAVTYNAFAFPFNDTGVAKEFYNQTHYNGLIDISFGTSDFSKGSCVNNLQRQIMEGRNYHADLIYKKLISQEVLRSIKYKLNLVK